MPSIREWTALDEVKTWRGRGPAPELREASEAWQEHGRDKRFLPGPWDLADYLAYRARVGAWADEVQASRWPRARRLSGSRAARATIGLAALGLAAWLLTLQVRRKGTKPRPSDGITTPRVPRRRRRAHPRDPTLPRLARP